LRLGAKCGTVVALRANGIRRQELFRTRVLSDIPIELEVEHERHNLSLRA